MEAETVWNGGCAIQLAWIETFLSTVDTGSVTRAAQQLHLTPPAAGKHIRRLEEYLGMPLFVRTPQGMTLTEAGTRVVDPFRALVNAWDDVQRAMARPAAPVRIGTLPSLATTVVPRLLWNLRVEHGERAEVALYPTSDRIRHAFLRGEIDLGLLDAQSAPTGCWQATLFGEPLVVVMRADHPWAPYSLVPGEWLGGKPLVMFPVGCAVRQALDHWLMTRGLPLNVALEMPFGGSLLGSVLAGQGTTVMPQSATDHHDPQRMTVRPIADGPSRQVVAVARSPQWESALTTCSRAMAAPRPR